MRGVPVVEMGIREASAFCAFAETAYLGIDRRSGQATWQIFSFAQSFLGHCNTAARLLWSREFANHTDGRTIAAILGLPRYYHVDDDKLREILEHYDRRLASGLSARGEVGKILDFTIGDRDAFEEEFSVFLRHYDPRVDTPTVMEEEFNLHRLWTEIADIKERANT